MHQTSLPLWINDLGTTYTELQRIVKRKECEPELVVQAKRSLVAFEQAVTHIEGVRALYALNDLVMELAILDAVWEDLSTMLFETTLMAANTLNKKSKAAIRATFNHVLSNARAAPAASLTTSLQ